MCPQDDTPRWFYAIGDAIGLWSGVLLALLLAGHLINAALCALCAMME